MEVSLVLPGQTFPIRGEEPQIPVL